MKVVPIDQVLKFSPMELLTDLHKNTLVEFHDKEIIDVRPNDLIISRYIWDVVKDIPGFRINSDLLATNYYENGFFNKKTTKKSFEVILKRYVKSTPSFNNQPTENALRKVFKDMLLSINKLYNELVFYTEEFQASFDILDLLEIQRHPKLLSAIEECSQLMTSESIEKVYVILDGILLSSAMDHNPVAIAFRAGTLSPGQLRQVLGIRGKGSELTGEIYEVPITSSYTKGIHNALEQAIDSRGCADALAAADKEISESEYFARRVQLVTTIVENIEYQDCGSKNYLDWEIPNRKVLEMSKGKYYLTEEGNEVPIEGFEDHLIGKTIKIRYIMGCNLDNPRHVCSKCYGDLAYTNAPDGNLGHDNGTNVTKTITQALLSKKHYIISATASAIVLSNVANQFFTVYKKRGMALRKDLKYKSLKIKIAQKQAPGILNLDLVASVKELEPSRVTKLTSFIIETTDKNDEVIDHYIDLNSTSHLTHLALDYVKKMGQTVVGDYIVIEISKWSLVKSFIHSPESEYSFYDLLMRIKKYVKSGPLEFADVVLYNLFDIINSKLSVNLSLIEVIIYAMTVRNPEGGDFSLARGVDKPRIMKMDDIIHYRSLGHAYAWERQSSMVFNPLYFKKNKEALPLDCLLKPDKYLKRFYEM